MDRVRRHLKSLTVALAAVALSAGLVAGHEMPGAADDGLATAAEAAQKTVPVGPPAVEPEVPVVEEPVVAEEPELDDVDSERPQNHGWFVSEAANAETPDGFRNHGEYVSSVARGNDGMPEAAATGKARADAAPGQAQAAAAKAKARGGD